MSEETENLEGRVHELLTPHRLGLARMVDSGRKVQQLGVPTDRRVALHLEALRSAGFPMEMLTVLLALAIDQLSANG